MAKAVQTLFARRLPYPLYIKGGPTLATLAAASAYMLKLSDHHAMRQHWQCAAELMLDEGAEVDVIARQLHLALLLDCVLDTSETDIPRLIAADRS
jgi:hypothetical protein